MASSERFRSAGARGIARFLEEHQDCDAGFDVSREGAGGGRLTITCQGCGQTVNYKAAEAGELAAAGLVPGADNGLAAPAPAAATPPPGAPPKLPPGLTTRRVRTRTAPRRRGFPRWLSGLLIAVLIAGGLTMIGAGLVKDEEGTNTATQPETNRQQSAKPGAGAKPQTSTQQQQAQQPTQKQQQTQQGAPGTASAALDRREFQNRFAIGVPRGWKDGAANGAITLTGPGATAEIQVFFESGSRSPGQMAGAASTFLKQRHQGAQVSKSQRFKLGQSQAARITATYPAGAEEAVLVSAGGFAYVVLRRVDRGASQDLEQQADAAVASFRPL